MRFTKRHDFWKSSAPKLFSTIPTNLGTTLATLCSSWERHFPARNPGSWKRFQQQNTLEWRMFCMGLVRFNDIYIYREREIDIICIYFSQPSKPTLCRYKQSNERRTNWAKMLDPQSSFSHSVQPLFLWCPKKMMAFKLGYLKMFQNPLKI